jgi:hypothetical protein
MTRNNQNSLIAVDSETGIYWHGERALQTKEEIHAFIERQAARPRTKRAAAQTGSPLPAEPGHAAGYCFMGHALQ